MNVQKIKWYTITKYHDIERGIEVSKSQFERENYIILHKFKTVEINGKAGTITWYYECERSKQTELKFG